MVKKGKNVKEEKPMKLSFTPRRKKIAFPICFTQWSHKEKLYYWSSLLDANRVFNRMCFAT